MGAGLTAARSTFYGQTGANGSMNVTGAAALGAFGAGGASTAGGGPPALRFIWGEGRSYPNNALNV